MLDAGLAGASCDGTPGICIMISGVGVQAKFWNGEFFIPVLKFWFSALENY